MTDQAKALVRELADSNYDYAETENRSGNARHTRAAYLRTKDALEKLTEYIEELESKCDNPSSTPTSE
jgi:hypothetical protein